MSLSAHSEKYSMNNEALLRMLHFSHEWALKEIFDRFHMRLFNVAYGTLRDEAVAKDLVQDVFIDLWRRREQSAIQNLEAYLLRAIKFQTLKYLRNGKIQEYHLKLVNNIEFVNQTEESLNFQELETQINIALEELPPRCREVFILSRMENLSHKEISDRLNISTKTVETQIGKALQYIRAKISVIAGLILLLTAEF